MSNQKSVNPTNKLPPTPESQNTATAIEAIRRMFVDVVQYRNIVNEQQTPAKRAAFIKQHGSAYGIFQVNDDLDEKYRIGIFQPGFEYPVWVRYSSDIKDNVPDKNSTVGIGIKLFNVPGEKALEEDADATTLDFILQNTEVFFAADAREMSEFKTAALNGTLDIFLQEHPETARILNEMENRTVESVLTETLWSCIPYKFGENDYCKYELKNPSSDIPEKPTDKNDPDYLAKDLQKRLLEGEVRLDFNIQLRNNPKTQSIISARSLWKLDEAIPVKVATLILPQQKVLARAQNEYGESLSFNPWRTLKEMIPVGSIAEARKVVYRSSAQVRRHVNGQVIGEPTEPRAPGAPTPPYSPTFEEPWPPAKGEEPLLPAPIVPESNDNVLESSLVEATIRVISGARIDDKVYGSFNGSITDDKLVESDNQQIELQITSEMISEAKGKTVEVFYIIERNGRKISSPILNLTVSNHEELLSAPGLIINGVPVNELSSDFSDIAVMLMYRNSGQKAGDEMRMSFNGIVHDDNIRIVKQDGEAISVILYRELFQDLAGSKAYMQYTLLRNGESLYSEKSYITII